MTENPKQADRIRLYKLAKSAHKPKNRSSKHLRRINQKPIERCLSGEAIRAMADGGSIPAQIELQRRARRQAKKAEKAGNGQQPA